MRFGNINIRLAILAFALEFCPLISLAKSAGLIYNCIGGGSGQFVKM
jgi:hypothetical protein